MSKHCSDVWNFFSEVDKETSKCDLCLKTIKRKGGSTSAMRNHLLHVHKKTDLTEKKTSRQTSLQEYNKSKRELSPEVYNKINRALALACALDLRPISMTMGRGFRYFCSLLNPAYKVPCSATVTKNLLLIYEEHKKDLIELVAGCPVSFTTDLWTAIGARGYITITGHFITKDWKVKAIVFATRPMDESHTADNIAKALEAMKNEFGITKLVGLTTDNAANMKLAGSIMNVIQWMCFSHGLQLAVEQGLKLPQIKKATGGARNLVSRFHRSSLATAKLKEKQILAATDEAAAGEVGPSVKPKCLIQSVPTRWNSEYFMAQRLLELRIPVFSVLMDPVITKQKNRKEVDLSDRSWTVLEDIVPVLGDFAKATEALTKEDTPTLSQAPVLLHNLVMVSCEPCVGDSSVAKNLKKEIKKNLLTRFDLGVDGIPNNIQSPAMVACFLDPRYKSMTWGPSENQKEDLSDYVADLIPTDTAEAAVESRAVIKTEDGVRNILDCLIGDIDIDLTASDATAKQEVEQYLAEPVRMQNPLDWWRVNETRYKK